jgi:hypothetical protein
MRSVLPHLGMTFPARRECRVEPNAWTLTQKATRKVWSGRRNRCAPSHSLEPGYHLRRIRRSAEQGLRSSRNSDEQSKSCTPIGDARVTRRRPCTRPGIDEPKCSRRIEQLLHVQHGATEQPSNHHLIRPVVCRQAPTHCPLGTASHLSH